MASCSMFCLFLCFFIGLAIAAVPKNDSNDVTTTPATVMTLKEVERNIEKLTGIVTKMLLPYFVRNSDLNLTAPCMSTLIKLFVDVRKLKLPAIKLLDAMAKPPYGMLKGSFSAMGDYDECLSVSANKKGDVATSMKDVQYKGQYCTVDISMPPSVLDGMREYGMGRKNISDFGKLKPFIEEFPVTSFTEYLLFRAGICMPSTCTQGDLTEIIKIVLDFATVNFIPVRVKRCETMDNKPVSADQIAIFLILGIVLAVVVIGSSFEGWLYLNENKYKPGKLAKFLLAFSIYSNTKEFLRIKKDSSYEISCINGMYVMGTLLVVVYHTYFLPFFAYFSRDIANLGRYLNAPDFTLIAAMGISIDAYFLFSGLFLTYGRFKRGGKNTEVKVIKLLVRRYFRLCPSMMLIVGLIIIMPLFGSGPVWADIIGFAAENGKKWWYTYVGMYNNFLPIKDQTYLYLWFIPCLMQITIVGAILAWILSKSFKCGVVLTILVSVACNVALGVLTVIRNYPPTYAIYYIHNREYFEEPIYTAPLSHVASFCIGMLLGYYMSQRTNLIWSKSFTMVGWIVALLLTLGTQYLMYLFHEGRDANPIFAAVYAATHRTAFSLGMAYIILACTYGYGGVFAKFLCWKGFGPLSKLGYCAYLIHYLVIVLHVSYSRTAMEFSHFEVWIRIWSYTTLTFLAAFVFYIVFELPLNYIESLFLPARRTIEKTPDDIFENTSNLHQNIIAFGDSKMIKNGELYSNNLNSSTPVKIVLSDEQSRL